MLYQKWSKIMLIALIAWFPFEMAGCNKIEMQRFRTVKEETPKDAAKSRLKMGSHDVTVVPGSELTAHSEMIRSDGSRMVEHFEFNVGETQVVIEDENLFVNQKFYGKLGKGDAVLVDHERVHVNGRAMEIQQQTPTAPVERPRKPVKIPTVA